MQRTRAGTTAPGFRKHPDYDIEIKPSQDLHQIMFNEAIVAASDCALMVYEQNHRPVVYFPIRDIDMSLLIPSEKSSHCPFKGNARYWSISANGETADDAVWSYPSPYTEVARLSGYLAFYLNKMTCHWRNSIEQPLLGPGNCETIGCDELRAA